MSGFYCLYLMNLLIGKRRGTSGLDAQEGLAGGESVFEAGHLHGRCGLADFGVESG